MRTDLHADPIFGPTPDEPIVHLTLEAYENLVYWAAIGMATVEIEAYEANGGKIH